MNIYIYISRYIAYTCLLAIIPIKSVCLGLFQRWILDPGVLPFFSQARALCTGCQHGKRHKLRWTGVFGRDKWSGYHIIIRMFNHWKNIVAHVCIYEYYSKCIVHLHAVPYAHKNVYIHVFVQHNRAGLSLYKSHVGWRLRLGPSCTFLLQTTWLV